MAQTTTQAPHSPDAQKRFEDGKTYSVRGVSRVLEYKSDKVVRHAIRTGRLRARQPYPGARLRIDGVEANRWWEAAYFEPPANSIVSLAPDVPSPRRRSGKPMPILR